MFHIDPPMVMGILNITPDSLHDAGRFFSADQAVQHGLDMVEQGAAIIDMGGESTRPGAIVVSADEQLQRILPVIENLASKTNALISVDTSEPEVMRAAVAAGANIINDARALMRPGALSAVIELGVDVCIMDRSEQPLEFLQHRVETCLTEGLLPEHIIIDPGFGFGKSVEHNMQLLGKINEFKRLGYPVLASYSHKGSINKLVGDMPAAALGGSLATAIILAINGADIIRVHDVAETVGAIKILKAIQSLSLS